MRISDWSSDVCSSDLEKLVPLEARVAEDDAIPEEILRDFREMGLFGLTTPEEHGGLGLRSSEEIEVIMELTWSSAAFRSIVGINLGLGSQALLIDGTPDQQAEWLPRIAPGGVIRCFCLQPEEVLVGKGGSRTCIIVVA